MDLVLDGISLALRSGFSHCQVWGETVSQGVVTPAFLVLLDEAQVSPFPNGRWRYDSRFEVRYFPKDGRAECYLVAEDLAQVLDVIAMPNGDMVRGRKVSFSVEDDVLHFFISYGYFALTVDGGGDMMETLEM